MISYETPLQLSVTVAERPAPAVAVPLDAAFEARWAAWVQRGRLHEQRARRKFAVWAGVIATAAAIAFTLLR
jgi:hypothetical protein